MGARGPREGGMSGVPRKGANSEVAQPAQGHRESFFLRVLRLVDSLSPDNTAMQEDGAPSKLFGLWRVRVC